MAIEIIPLWTRAEAEEFARKHHYQNLHSNILHPAGLIHPEVIDRIKNDLLPKYTAGYVGEVTYEYATPSIQDGAIVDVRRVQTMSMRSMGKLESRGEFYTILGLRLFSKHYQNKDSALEIGVCDHTLREKELEGSIGLVCEVTLANAPQDEEKARLLLADLKQKYQSNYQALKECVQRQDIA